MTDEARRLPCAFRCIHATHPWKCAAAEPRLTREEGQPYLPGRVVAVGIDEADRLPDAEREATAEDRHGGVRRDERRHHMIPPVTRRSMPMLPAVVEGQHV